MDNQSGELVASQFLGLIDKIQGKINIIRLIDPHMLSTNNEKFDDLFSDLNTFVSFSLLISYYFKKSGQNHTCFVELNLSMLSILKMIKTLHQQDDYIAVQDLISEELKDILVEWKIKTVPLISHSIHYSNP